MAQRKVNPTNGTSRVALLSSDVRSKRFRRSALMASQQPLNVSTRLVDSYKAAMEELEESEKRVVVPRDLVGEQMALLLNSNPEFRTPAIVDGDPKEEDIEDDWVFHWPLFSWHNWNIIKRCGRRMEEMSWADLANNVPTLCRGATNFLFWNSKSVQGLVTLCLGLIVFSLGIMTGGITVVALWSGSILWIVAMKFCTMLVDWNALWESFPEGTQKMGSQILPLLRSIDSVVLQGRRTAGREWNKDDFELDDTNKAQSIGLSLWELPPPTIRDGKRLCIDEEYLTRSSWSPITTKHVVAVDFCYVMLREEHLRKQASRRKRTFLSKRFASESSVLNAQLDGSSSIRRSLGHDSFPIVEFDGKQVSPLGCSPTIIECSEGQQRRSMPPRRMSSITFSPSDVVGMTGDQNLQYSDSFSKLTNMGDDVRQAPTEDDPSDDSSDSPTPNQDVNESSDNSFESTTTETVGNWMDVGAEIGLKILGSAHVQRAMASKDTERRIKETLQSGLGKRNAAHLAAAVGVEEINDYELEAAELDNKQPLSVPVHPIWTSAAAAANNSILASAMASDRQKALPYSERSSPLFMSPDDSFDSASRPLEASSTSKPAGDGRRFSRRRKIKSKNIRRLFRRRRDKRGFKELPNHDALESNWGPVNLNIAAEDGPGRRDASSPMSADEAIEVVCGRKPDVVSSSPLRKSGFRVPHFLPGVKVVVPIFPIQPGLLPSTRMLDSRFQMGTVVSSARISVDDKDISGVSGNRSTNCLSVTVKLDKSFLRNGKFAEMTFRIMDSWGPRYVPKHSKLPIGSCVATNFGLGVLVGWRVEDDCHVVRSLWQKRGPGSACAYLRRDAIHSTVEAAVGFEVGTPFGEGTVVAYVDGRKDFRSGRYFVAIKEDGRQKGKVLEFNRRDITSCSSARFIPVIELIREAAQYRLQVDRYEAALREREGSSSAREPDELWRSIPEYSDILWKSFLKAIEEDTDFDEGLNHFMTSIIDFLERLDRPDNVPEANDCEEQNIVITATDSTASKVSDEKQEPGFWIMNDMFGGIFNAKANLDDPSDELKNERIEVEMQASAEEEDGPTSIDRAFSVIRTLMRTVSIARAACVDEPNFRLSLSICYEFLIFVKTVVRVQQKNVSPKSLAVWRRAWEQIVSTFGPVKERLEKIGKGIAERMEKQGRRAKVRLLRLVDNIVKDDSLLIAVEQGDWDRCATQLELAMVAAKIIDEANREHYHKTAQFVYGHFAFASSKNAKNPAPKEKLAHLALVVQCLASPWRSFLKLFLRDNVLEVLERIFVRVFDKEEETSRMLAIHASNFHSLRHFRMLKDFTIAGRLWMPLLDAADAEFSWVVSRMPENAKEFMRPLSSLFSLCVVQFHKISEGDLTTDWLDFLLEDEAVNIVHDINMKLILALESFSRDIKEMMVVLPYYPSIEEDILNLMDEVDLDEFLKEAADAIDDAEKLSEFIREKAIIAIEGFLDYLPKMSIPVEKRDLGDGWMITCRGEDGGDLTLSDVNIKRENLICQVMGGDTIFFPMLGSEDEAEFMSTVSLASSASEVQSEGGEMESSILDHIRVLLSQAQKYGCWQVGVGGVGQPPTDRYVASALHGLPVSIVLNTAIELWRNLEIDDDELLEIAIRDVSYQIQLQQGREEIGGSSSPGTGTESKPAEASATSPIWEQNNDLDSFESHRHRFNPRVDPTVLFLEMKKLTLNLEGFQFRIEKHEDYRTLFDPVFEGCGSLTVQNVSIKLGVECAKERVKKVGSEVNVPTLQLRELDVQLEKVKLKVRDTGADWLLNKVVKGFSDNITKILASNLKDQVQAQLELALQHLNSYCEVNPDIMLGLLGITMDDLEEKVVWV